MLQYFASYFLLKIAKTITTNIIFNEGYLILEELGLQLMFKYALKYYKL